MITAGNSPEYEATQLGPRPDAQHATGWDAMEPT